MAKKTSKPKMTILIIALAIAAVVGVKFFLAAMPATTSVADARSKGNKNAPIQITEFIDFECPACATGAKRLSQIMGEHPDAIRLNLKYFPLKNHRHGFLSARYAECAARQGKFWPFADALVERQANWSRLMDATPAFVLMAREAGMDEGKLKACLEDKSVDATIEQSRIEGEQRGIKSTPTYYINGKMFVGVPSLETELARLLAEIKK